MSHKQTLNFENQKNLKKFLLVKVPKNEASKSAAEHELNIVKQLKGASSGFLLKYYETNEGPLK